MRHRGLIAPPAIVVATLAVGLAGAAMAQLVLGLGGTGAAAALALSVSLAFGVRPMEGLAAFLVATLLAESVHHWTGIDLRFLDEMGIPLLVVVAVTVHRQRLAVPRLGLAETGLAVFLAAGIVSSLVNGVPASVVGPGLVLLLKGFVFFYLVASMRLEVEDVRRMALPILAVTMLVTAIGAVQLLSPTVASDILRLPSAGGQRGALDVVSSVFTHPALFGWLTAFASLFLYARFTVLHTRWALPVALMLNAGTLLSGRRAPVIGLVAGLVVGAARQISSGRAQLRVWALVAVTVLVVLAASVPLLGDFYRRTVDQYARQLELAAEVFADAPDDAVIQPLHPRVALYVGSAAVARDELPFGAGIGRYASHMSREVYSPVYDAYGLDRVYGLRERHPIAVTDTFWPMVLGETGVIGLIGAGLFFGAVAMRLWFAAGASRRPEVQAFALGALLVFVEGLVRSLISAVYLAPPIAYFVFGAAALALALDRDAGEDG